MNESTHRELRESLGWLAIGRVEDAERSRLEAHLDGCAACRAELADLVATTGRLALVDPDRLDDQPAPPADLGDRVITAALRSGHPRRRTGWLVAAAAAVVLALGGLGGWLLRPVPQVATVPLEPVAVTSNDTAVRASAELIPHTWGVEIQLTATGFSAGERYTVEVVSADGTHPGAGAFIGVGERSMRCNLNSPVLRSDATGFRVLDDSGAVVVASSF
ncbi:MAG: zf-HC2 domain-containing protein [Nakamurella sp.]